MFKPIQIRSNWGYFPCLDGKDIKDGEVLEIRWPDQTITMEIALLDTRTVGLTDIHLYVNKEINGLTRRVEIPAGLMARRVKPKGIETFPGNPPPEAPIVMKELIYENLDELGQDELRIVYMITQRILKGKKQYGELKIKEDKRDFKQEAMEEVLDAMVYSACEMLK